LNAWKIPLGGGDKRRLRILKGIRNVDGKNGHPESFGKKGAGKIGDAPGRTGGEAIQGCQLGKKESS